MKQRVQVGSLGRNQTRADSGLVWASSGPGERSREVIDVFEGVSHQDFLRLGIGCERMREHEDDGKVSGLINWKDGAWHVLCSIKAALMSISHVH